MIAKFGSFADTIAAPRERLLEVDGVKEGTLTALKIVEAAALGGNHGLAGIIGIRLEPAAALGRFHELNHFAAEHEIVAA